MATRKMPEAKVEETAIVNDKPKTKKVEPVFGIVKDCSSLNIRKNPSITSDIVGVLKVNDTIKILNNVDGWYKIKDGFVMADYISLT